MRTIIFAAALACSTAAFAQTSDTAATADMSAAPAAATTDMSAAPTAAPAPSVETGATTKIIAKGEHYTVHRVLADGTVMVQTLTGEQAKMAMAGEMTPQLASANYGVTQGAGTTTPQQ